jgi:dephospho-CoA kinase/inosine/xanthosine triphosphate pyrophosphatase family protein
MLELIFFTSNRTKTIHARYLCKEYNINIVNFREKTYYANYTEPRTSDRDFLLKESLESALEQAKKAGLDNHPFIIEDTSVIIHALSNHDLEYPGTDVKYWMRETKFDDIDFQLRFFGNNRKVTVRSDLILFIPKLGAFRFSSQSEGNIVEKENKNLETNTLYPWLDNRSFNKWFSPGKEGVAISELPIDIADKYDFRRAAFDSMLEKLAIQNLVEMVASDKVYNSPRKYYDESICHIVVGLSCSGKSTIADYLSQKFNFFHIEASDFMHLIYLETHGERSEVKIGDFARDLLSIKPTEVAKKVLNFLEIYHWPNIVITGFRKFEEIEFIQRNLAAGGIRTILIDADTEIRHERYIKRNRDSAGYSQEDFMKRDIRELSMGLERISNDSSIEKLLNASSIDDYFHNYVQLTKPIAFHIKYYNNSEELDDLKLKDLITIALFKSKTKGEQSSFLTTGEVCKIVNSTLGLKKPKFINNVARLLNQSFDVFFEVKFDKRNNKKLYRLSNTGTGHARTLIKRCRLS